MSFDHMTFERFDHAADLIGARFEHGTLGCSERVQFGRQANEVKAFTCGSECTVKKENELTHFAARCSVCDTESDGKSGRPEVVGNTRMAARPFTVECAPDGKSEFMRFAPDIESFVCLHENRISCARSGTIIKTLQMHTFLRFNVATFQRCDAPKRLRNLLARFAILAIFALLNAFPWYRRTA